MEDITELWAFGAKYKNNIGIYTNIIKLGLFDGPTFEEAQAKAYEASKRLFADFEEVQIVEI